MTDDFDDDGVVWSVCLGCACVRVSSLSLSLSLSLSSGVVCKARCVFVRV